MLSGGCDLLFQIDHLNASDAGRPIDGNAAPDADARHIVMTARAKTAANATAQNLALAFDTDQPALTDFTIAAVCYNHTNTAMVASIKDAQGHGLEHLLTSTTTNEYTELWAGHIAGDLALKLTLPADFPD